jgi:hypothetical protein
MRNTDEPVSAGVTVAMLIIVGTILVCGIIGAACWGYPQYSVYAQRLEGEAELAKAEYSKRVAVQTATATRDSASLLAEAEARRAEGVARANKIIGDSLKDNESYLRYLWIHSLQDGKNEVIYVPTEANLPILEASRPHHMNAAPAASSKP